MNAELKYQANPGVELPANQSRNECWVEFIEQVIDAGTDEQPLFVEHE